MFDNMERKLAFGHQVSCANATLACATVGVFAPAMSVPYTLYSISVYTNNNKLCFDSPILLSCTGRRFR